MFESIDGRLKPLAIMIKRAYIKYVIYVILSVVFSIVMSLGIFIFNLWFGMMSVPIYFCMLELYKLEGEINDLLISI